MDKRDYTKIAYDAEQKFGEFVSRHSRLMARLRFNTRHTRYCSIPLDYPCYGYVPSRGVWLDPLVLKELDQFLEGGRAFVDLGCGVGHLMKLAVLPMFQGTITGVELDRRTFIAAKSYLTGTGVEVIREDLFTVPLNGYDRVYTYAPVGDMVASPQAPVLYERILKGLRPGTRWFEYRGWMEEVIGHFKACGYVVSLEGRSTLTYGGGPDA